MPPAPNDPDAVLAIDPGRAKCGVAIVRRNGETPYRAIIPIESLASELISLVETYRPMAAVVGNGTGSGSVLELVRSAAPEIDISLVDESYTSEQARRRYVAQKRPTGFQRLLPLSLRTPDSAYDDHVAVILAERYWESRMCD